MKVLIDIAAMSLAFGTSTAWGATYYLAPTSMGGNDSNSGTIASSPWLTPNHSINCGDTIIALPSTAYSNADFSSGKWGTVSCSTGDNVAWLKCQDFDQCKMTVIDNHGFYVDKSYWGVQGFEVNANASTAGACFGAAPSSTNPANIHHIVFANNVANGCQDGGLESWNLNKNSVDYFAIVGNIAYNAAQGSQNCYSGISVYEPVQSDWVSGTHIYIAGNLSYGNIDPKICAGGMADGGDGIILDTFDGSQQGTPTFAAQAAVENNIAIGNGWKGLEVQNNAANNLGNSLHAPIFLINNTVTGNALDNAEVSAMCSEADINVGFNIWAWSNLFASTTAEACGGNYKYGFLTYDGDSTDSIAWNFIYGVTSWQDESSWTDTPAPKGAIGSFSFGTTNINNIPPAFTDPVIPGAPKCSGYSSVAACMAQTVASYVPKASQAAGYGYQVPSNTYSSDDYFPAWLCGTNLPTGLVSNHCMKFTRGTGVELLY